MIVILLPSSPCSSAVRTLTGTAPRSSSPSVRTPRPRSQLASAPLTTARKTSLTVPPSEFLISFSSASSASTQSTRRWVPIGSFNGETGARLTVPHSTSLAPSAVSRSSPAVFAGLAAARSARSASENGVLISSFTPRPTTSASLGSGPGDHSWSGWGISAGSRSRSNSTVMMSTPETPSTSA